MRRCVRRCVRRCRRLADDLNVLMTKTLTDIVNGKVAAGPGLRDAAEQVTACLAKA